MSETSGRGGQPAKIILETTGGWAEELKFSEIQFQRDAAIFTIEALQSIDAPRALYPQALKIVLEYRRMMRVHDYPQATSDKNKSGLGSFADVLRRRSDKMANQLADAVADKRSKQLNDDTQAGDLQSHMTAAWESLTAIVDLIDRWDRGVTPISKAEIRREAGRKLKELAEQNGLRVADFVLSFNIYQAESVRLNTAKEQMAFDKWLDRLDD